MSEEKSVVIEFRKVRLAKPEGRYHSAGQLRVYTDGKITDILQQANNKPFMTPLFRGYKKYWGKKWPEARFRKAGWDSQY